MHSYKLQDFLFFFLLEKLIFISFLYMFIVSIAYSFTFLFTSTSSPICILVFMYQLPHFLLYRSLTHFWLSITGSFMYAFKTYLHTYTQSWHKLFCIRATGRDWQYTHDSFSKFSGYFLWLSLSKAPTCESTTRVTQILSAYLETKFTAASRCQSGQAWSKILFPWVKHQSASKVGPSFQALWRETSEFSFLGRQNPTSFFPTVVGGAPLSCT